MYRIIEFNQKAWLEEYLDINTKLRTERKDNFKKDFFKKMNNTVFRKTMKNERKHKDIELVTTERRKNQLVSKPNYCTTKWFSKNWSAIEMKKIKVKMNKALYLGLSVLGVSKTLMYEFCYDYIKLKYQDNAKLIYMDTGSIFTHIKTEDFYKDVAHDVEKLYDASNYKDHYLKEKIKKL